MWFRQGLIVVFIGGLSASPATASNHGWDVASGVGRDALVVAALGVPAIQQDWRGDIDAGESLIATGGATYLLKQLIHEERPDQSNDNSFPSGHTSISFAAAATLEKRYGWHAGLPALVIASFVGIGRVEADKHYWHDVVAGAALGGITGFLLTAKRNDRIRLIPFAGHKSGGFSVTARF